MTSPKRRPSSLFKPYQKRLVKSYLDDRQHGAIVDMGLGKTATVLFLIEYLKRQSKGGRWLIVAPLNVVQTVWRQEADEWEYTKDLKFITLHGNNKNSLLGGKADIYLINYEGLKWFSKKMKAYYNRRGAWPFMGLVLDESTSMKDPTTQRFKNFKALISLFDYRLILTGTFMPNSPLDLWAQYYTIDLGEALGSSFYSYRSRYFEPAGPFNYRLRAGAKEEIVELLSPRITRLKASDYKDIPDLVYQEHRIDLPKDLQAKYDQLEKEFFLELDEVGIEAFNKAALGLKLRQFTQGFLYWEDDYGNRETKLVHKHKLNALNEFADQMSGEPFICGLQFQAEYDFLRSQKRYKDSPFIVGKSKHKKDLPRWIEKWNRREVPHMFTHPQSLSYGSNMQNGGHHIYWHAIPWSYLHFSQLNGRLTRERKSGDQRPAIAHLSIVNNTMDEVVLPRLKDKEFGDKEFSSAIAEYRRQKLG